MKLLKTTILGGVLFLVPFVFLVIILEKALGMARQVADPIKSVFPDNSFFGINVIVVAILLVFCFMAGVLAQKSGIAMRVGQLDKALTAHLPGYMQIKTVVGGRFGEDEEKSLMIPVLVRGADGSARLGFEVDRQADGLVVIFFPGVPNPQSGSAFVYPVDAIEILDMPTHKAMDMMQFYGRGLAKIVEDSNAKTALSET